MSTPASPPVSVEDIETEELIRRSGFAFSSRNYDEAHELLDAAGRRSPGSAAVQLWQARVALKRSDWHGLLAAGEALANLQSPTLEMLQYRALALSNLGDWTLAAKAWHSVNDKSPGNLETLDRLAVAAAESGQYGLAQFATKGMRQHELVDARFLRRAGDVLLSIGALADAHQVFVDLTNRERESSAKAFGQFINEGNLRSAAVVLSALGAAALEDPMEAELLSHALLKEAVHQERLGGLEEALLNAFAASMISPADPLLSSNVARVEQLLITSAESDFAAARYSDALRTASFLSRLFPDRLTALRLLANAEAKSGDRLAAIRSWKAVLDSDASNEEALAELARLSEQVGNIAEATDCWARILALPVASRETRRDATGYPKRTLALGKSALAGSNYFEAWRILSQVPKHSEVFGDAMRWLPQASRGIAKHVRASFKSGAHEEIVNAAGTVFNPLWSEPDTLRLVAKSAMKLRRFDIGVRAWQEYRRISDGGGLETNLGLARCCLEMGDRPMAETELQVALAVEPENSTAIKLMAELRKAAR